MRVWERGTGETYACGTGACVSYYVCNMKGLVKNEGKVYLKGGELKINIDDESKEITMCGLVKSYLSKITVLTFNFFPVIISSIIS